MKDARGHGSNGRGGGNPIVAERTAMRMATDARHFPPSRSQLGITPTKPPVAFSAYGRALIASKLGLGLHSGAINSIKGRLPS